MRGVAITTGVLPGHRRREGRLDSMLTIQTLQAVRVRMWSWKSGSMLFTVVTALALRARFGTGSLAPSLANAWLIRVPLTLLQSQRTGETYKFRALYSAPPFSFTSITTSEGVPNGEFVNGGVPAIALGRARCGHVEVVPDVQGQRSCTDPTGVHRGGERA